MKSDILYENRYLASSPEEMQYMQRVIFSNGFRGFNKSCEVWDNSMWLSNMSIVVKEYKSGDKEWGWGRNDHNKKINDFKLKWRYKMNEIIIEMFPKTKEAVLVDKWFGREIDKPIFKMLIIGKEKELVAEAFRLEKELASKSK